MKQWMIWTGAGILGIGLAAALIPWVGVGILPSEPLPEVQTTAPTPRASASEEITPIDVSTAGPGTPVDEPPEANYTPPPSVNAAPPPLEDGNVGEFQNPARKARAERLKEPDMVAARHLSSRWREINFRIGKMPHDPAGENTVNRMRVLQQDMQRYRRDPEAFEIEELIDRQGHIIGELKQTSYWGPEMARMVQDMEAATQNYHDAD